MPMQKSPIDLPLAIGLDTKSDPKVAKGLLSVRNGEVRSTGIISKRRALVPLGRDVIDGGISELSVAYSAGPVAGWRPNSDTRLAHGLALYGRGGQLIVRGEDEAAVDPLPTHYDGSLVAAFDPSVRSWLPRGIVPPVAVTYKSAGLLLNTTVTERFDTCLAIYRQYTVFAAQQATTLHVLIVNNEASEIVFKGVYTVSTSVIKPRCAFVRDADGETKFILFFSNGATSLTRITWNPSTPSVNPVFTASVFNDVDNNWLVDYAVTPAADALLIAYKQTATGNLIVRKVNASGTELVAAANIVVAILNEAICIFAGLPGGVEQYCVAFKTLATHEMRVIKLRADLTTYANFVLAAGTFHASAWSSISGTYAPLAGAQAAALIGVTNAVATLSNRSIMFAYIDDAGGPLVGTARSLQHARIYSKMFTYRDRPYLIALHDSPLQRTLFLYTFSPTARSSDAMQYPQVCTKTLYGSIVHALLNGTAPSFAATPTPTLSTTDGSTVIVSTASTKRAGWGELIELKFDLLDLQTPSLIFGNGVYVPGGIVLSLDGYWQELGFHIYPESITAASVADPFGIVDSGVHSYTVVLEWTDRNGELHRSTPSVPVSVTVPIGTFHVDVTVPTTWHIAYAKFFAPAVWVKIYRTVVGGSIYLLVNAFEAVNPTNAAYQTATTTFTDNVDDASLLARERLYTTGGVLETVAPPAGAIIGASHNRLFLVPYDDPTALYFTKPKEEGVAPEFVQGQYLRFESDGDITGFAVQDGAHIVFKRNAVYTFVGDGPNALGQGGFSPPRRLPGAIGCVDFRSVISTPAGILFRSEAGWYLFDRSQAVQPIGLAVAKYGTAPVVAAVDVPSREQVWIGLRDQKIVLVFDYMHKLWLTHELERTIAGLAYADGKVHYLGADGTVWSHDESAPAEAPLVIDTPWYKGQSLLGYLRIWWLYILGDLDGAFDVRVYYDYADGEDDYSQLIRFAAKRKRKMVRIKPAKRKCTAFRIHIEQTGDLRENMAINALSLLAGAKGRLAKLAGQETR